MATHGSLSEFDSAREDWTSYSERLEQYLLANGVTADDKKRAILISTSGPRTYQLMKSLLAPDKPTSKTFDEIVKLMKDHFQPKPSEIVQRFNFHSRDRRQGESIATYVAELKKLSEHCNFGNSDALDLMLRDRLVCGINDKRIQRSLLSETKLSYKRALELAQAMEAAERDTQELLCNKPAGVNNVQSNSSQRKGTQSSSGISCYRCGGGHRPSDCRFKEATCHFCGKRGHITTVCRRAKRLNQPATPTSFRQPVQQPTHPSESSSSTTPSSSRQFRQPTYSSESASSTTPLSSRQSTHQIRDNSPISSRDDDSEGLWHEYTMYNVRD